MAEKKRNALAPVAEHIRSASMALTIPAMLGVGPLVGWFLGSALSGWLFARPTAGGLVGLLLGFIAGVREAIRLVKRIGKE